MSNSARFERGSDLVFHHFHAGACSELFFAIFDDRYTTDVDTYTRIEFQCIAACRRLRISVNDADFIAQLVDKDADSFCFRDARCEFAQRLRHQAGLQTHLRIPHFTFDFGFRGQRGHRVDDDDVDSARTNQRIGDFECLFAIIGLRNQQIVDIDSQFLCVEAVECMFSIDECRDAACFCASAMA